jgi:hypothetical protein
LKKTLSILLLFVFLFNVGGYYIVFWALRHQSDKQLTSLLDAGAYQQDETVEVKIAVAFPYSSLMVRGFERVEGEFEYKGDYYRLVKQKIQNDTVYVVCIKNKEEKRLVNAMTDYVKESNDLPGTAKKALSFFSKLLKEYNSEPQEKDFQSTPVDLKFQYAEFSSTFSNREIPILSPPPKA